MKSSKQQSSEYLISFTAGGLLYEETSSLLHYLNDTNIDNLPGEIKNPRFLKTNSQAARQRVVQEVKKRYHATGEYVFKQFEDRDSFEQRILIFYTCIKTYKILYDFIYNVVTEKWLIRDLKLDTSDVRNFLDRQSGTHSEIDTWTESTQTKVSTVIIRMLNEVGMLKEGELHSLDAGYSFWRKFIEFGDPWFLQSVLLNKEQRELIQNV